MSEPRGLKKRHQAHMADLADDRRWELGLAVGWQGRLEADPIPALREMVTLYARNAAANPGTEALYWQAQIEHGGSLEALADAVLARLDPLSKDRLLDLRESERELLCERFGTDIGGSASRESQPATAARMAAAAALAHDRVSGEGDMEVVQRSSCILRLCRSMVDAEGASSVDAKTYLELARRVEKRLDRLWSEDRSLRRQATRLDFAFRFWIGEQLEHIEDIEGALEHYSEAALLEGWVDVEEFLECTLRRSRMYQRLGRHQDAFHVLEEEESKSRQIEDPLLQDRWSEAVAQARNRLRPASTELPVARGMDAREELSRSDDPDLEDILEAAAEMERAAEHSSILRAADGLFDALEAAWRRQPTSGTRRFLRQRSQRALENAALALFEAAEEARASSRKAAARPTSVAGEASESIRHRSLRALWRLIAATRNLDLHRAPTSPMDSQIRAHLGHLEHAFHGQLLHSLLYGTRRDWLPSLQALRDYEDTHVRNPAVLLEARFEPPQGCVALAFLEFERSSAGARWLSLLHYRGRYECGWADSSAEPLLDAWARNPEGRGSRAKVGHAAPGSGRREVGKGEAWGSEALADSISPVPIADLVPRPCRTLLEEPLPPPGLDGEEGSGSGGRAGRTPWVIFPSGSLHSVPLERQPTASRSPVTAGSVEPGFGHRHPVLLGLRSTMPAMPALDMSRGWIGLGGAPAVGGIPELPGTEEEVSELDDALRRRGTPTCLLLGSEANAARLAAELEKRAPSMLHLAVHGLADPEFPEACALVLAPCPGRPEGALLPFRRVQSLPLARVQLVVLSACSSLAGPSEASAGIEGLAWAFLQAGAGQVVASRYPVDDRETPTFMSHFYANLEEHPIAEALRRTRRRCSQLGLPARDIAAWSVWI